MNANVDVLNRSVVQLGGRGANSLDVRLSTVGDSYLLQNVILGVEVPSVVIDKSFDGTLDTQTLLEGETPSFVITVTNNGGVPLANVQMTDSLAPDCSTTFATLAPERPEIWLPARS